MFDVFPGYNATPMTELAMQMPMFSYGAPYALDWDSDGVLDLWHHNHFAFSEAESRWSDPSTDIIGPPNKGPGGCMVDWDAVLRNGDDGTYYAANGGDGFIEWTDNQTGRNCIDVHSTSFLDIDGDGYKDLFLITGGGQGKGNSPESDHMLFWGTPANSQLGFRLVGGKGAALAARLHGRDKLGSERGRHQYWLDVDGDGLLDFISLVNERADDAVTPGYLDMDGDGLAREFVVPSHCASSKNWVCKRAPRGTTSVYRLDPSGPFLVRESSTPPFRSDDKIANSIATGDFDFDGLADVAILWRERVSFHLSSARQQRCKGISNNTKRRKCLHSLGPPDKELKLTKCGSSGAAVMRFADFDLNGHIDMLVVCEEPGRHAIYELMHDSTWKEMQKPNKKTAHLGALNSPSLMLGGADFCEGIPITNKISMTSRPKCDKIFSPQRCKNVRYKNQFVICSLRAKSPDKFGPTAVGATVADIDNDGFSDVLVTYFLGSTVMFRNAFRDSGRKKFFVVRLDRTAGAAATIGAMVKVTTSRMGTYLNETTTQMRVISSLNHEPDANGGHEDRLIFGLGRRGKVKKLTVQWPHCCKETVILAMQGKFRNFYNSMIRPFEVPAPKNCDKTCFGSREG